VNQQDPLTLTSKADGRALFCREKLKLLEHRSWCGFSGLFTICPVSGSKPDKIAQGFDRNIWFTESGVSQVAGLF
jgi:hypothetical protein